MKRYLILAGLAVGLLCAAVVPFVSQSQAATCKWGTLGVGCSGDTLVILYANPAANCPGSTVDVQRTDCGTSSWSTFMTNVSSPVKILPATTNYNYRLVVNCTCGPTTIYSQALGCMTCP